MKRRIVLILTLLALTGCTREAWLGPPQRPGAWDSTLQYFQSERHHDDEMRRLDSLNRTLQGSQW